MASDLKQRKEQHEEFVPSLGHTEEADREAYHYWGYIFKDDKCGMPLLDRLLKGIAEVISQGFEPSESADLTPSQMAAWYRDVGGDYDVLFTGTPLASIAFIYRSLGAFHSLQPALDNDGYLSPTVPALKKQGFVIWQTIQLLLGPEEHVPFLQRTVEKYCIVDPDTGKVFPKILPKQCFPDCPDDAMESWYQGVAARLEREAEGEACGERSTDETGPRLSTEMSDGSSADDKHGAFTYFKDPMYRNARQRPTIMRHVPRQSVRAGDENSTVKSGVRYLFTPWGNRRKNVHGSYESDSYSDEESPRIAPLPPLIPRYASRRHLWLLKEDPNTDSESDPDNMKIYYCTPVPRTQRPHDLSESQPENFPDYQDAQSYLPQNEAGVKLEGQPTYRPTMSPLFATQVAQLQAQKYYHYGPALQARAGHRPAQHSVRWGPVAGLVNPPRDFRPTYTREQSPHQRDGGGAWCDAPIANSSSRVRRRRSTEDAACTREQNRESGRTRSHDRVRVEERARRVGRGSGWRGHWDERGTGLSREASCSLERDGEHQTHSVGGQIMRFLKEL